MLLTHEDLKREGSIVVIEQDGTTTYRPVAFVFDGGDGSVVWVEPSYADPYGAASPSMHRRPLAEVEIWPYEPGDQALVGDALEWFSGWLKANGLAWAEERDRVRALVGL